MKLFLAGTIIALSTLTASAEGVIKPKSIMSMLKPDASVEYGIKSKGWSGDVGATAIVGRLSVRPSMDWEYPSGGSIGIKGSSVKSTLTLSKNLSAYSKLSLDSDFKYSDISLGVAITFN